MVWPTAVVLTLTTGRVLCDFGEAHKLAEFLTGDDVYTHQFAHRPFWHEMRDALHEQHPVLVCKYSHVTKENWQTFRDEQVERLGPEFDIVPMKEWKTRAESFTEPLKLVGSKL